MAHCLIVNGTLPYRVLGQNGIGLRTKWYWTKWYG